jgi:serine/threonine protein kinase
MFELDIFENYEYSTPEEILKQPITDKIDLWALGILMYRLLTFEHPFKGIENKDT